MTREKENQSTVWIPIVRHQDLPLREGRAVVLGNQQIAVFNLGDRVLAVDNRCPHRDGPLTDGMVSGTTIICPLHAAKFNLETGQGSNALSAGHCIETFRTRVDNGIVSLELPLASMRKQEVPGACIDNIADSFWNESAAGN